MADFTTLHKKAMDLAEKAVVAKIKKDLQKSKSLFQEAYEAEREAAFAYADKNSKEPTRSVLFRSAAALALNAELFREAEQMACLGISGTAPVEILEELRDILEDVNFGRHLKLRGVELEERDIQLSIAGGETGLGVVQSEVFIEKFNTTERMFYRIVERKMKKPFREQGRIENSIKDNYQLYLSVPRAASYAVTIRIGKPTTQMLIPGTDVVGDIVAELMENLKLVNDGDETKLRERIPEDDYYQNFVALAKNLAPDGKKVNLIGFTANLSGEVKELALTRKKGDISPVPIRSTEKPVEITGTLSYADAKNKKIKVTDKKGVDHKVIVDKAILSDIVKPLWEDTVTLTGTIEGRSKEIRLISIEKAVDNAE